MRKIYALVMVLGIVGAVLGGCSKGEDANATNATNNSANATNNSAS